MFFLIDFVDIFPLKTPVLVLLIFLSFFFCCFISFFSYFHLLFVTHVQVCSCHLFIFTAGLLNISLFVSSPIKVRGGCFQVFVLKSNDADSLVNPGVNKQVSFMYTPYVIHSKIYIFYILIYLKSECVLKFMAS